MTTSRIDRYGFSRFGTRSVKQIVTALLEWFSTHARDLPWRRSTDPYAIWVSEIMLQQTQVKTVIPYWKRWMLALPDIASLATAKPEKIHKLWEGLGYYTRVRNMQKAAQTIMSRHDGKFPRNYEAILDLPGIGPYTTGAIASIAFNEAQPILDGNVIRVLTRLFAIAENPREPATNKRLWQLARDLVTQAKISGEITSEPKHQKIAACSAFNQSLMELGALICTPKSPDCAVCPLNQCCAARALNRVEQFPNLGPRTATTSRNFVAFIWQRDDRFLVRQRAAGQVNAHLWEFPNAEILPDASPAPELMALASSTLNCNVRDLTELCVIKHSITRYRITLRAFEVKQRRTVKLSAKTNGEGSWLTLDELNLLPFTSAHRKILSLLLARQNQP